MKPLPESGGTIYTIDATGTHDSRSGDSFKLLLELETASLYGVYMHQISGLV